jgi:hypothetical protein
MSLRSRAKGKCPEGQPATHSKKTDATKSGRKLLWAFAPLAIVVLWQNLPRQRNVPSELVGTWRTSDRRYAGRPLEIDKVIINFGTGEGTVTTGFIQQVHAVHEGSGTLYTISYVQDLEKGGEEQCSIYYTVGKNYHTLEDQETIYFKNQPGISWVKDNIIASFSDGSPRR